MYVNLSMSLTTFQFLRSVYQITLDQEAKSITELFELVNQDLVDLTRPQMSEELKQSDELTERPLPAEAPTDHDKRRDI